MRLVLVGAGAIARQHARAVDALPVPPSSAQVYDPRPSALASFVQQYPRFQAAASLEALFEPPASGGDLAIIATPPASHVDLAERAMLSGRHVLIEKPLSLSEADLRRLLKVSRETGRRFADCSVRFLGSPALLAAEKIAREGGIGKAAHIRWFHRFRRTRPGVEYQPESSWFLDKKLAGGGILVDWAPYDLCVLVEWLRPRAFEVRHAWTRQFVNGMEPSHLVNDVETQIGAACMLELEDGSRVELSYERASAVHGREEALAELEGDKGALRLDWLGWMDKGRLILSQDEQGKAVDQVLDPGKDPLDLQFKPLHFFAAALASGKPAAVEGARSCFIHACVLALSAAAEQGVVKRVERKDWEGA